MLNTTSNIGKLKIYGHIIFSHSTTKLGMKQCHWIFIVSCKHSIYQWELTYL